MPVLKISAKSSPTKYSGDWGDIQNLKNALQLLFQIKAAEYQTKYPKFIAPTVEEFLDFTFQQNNECLKQKAIHRGKKRKERRTIQAKSPLKEQTRMAQFFSLLFRTEFENTLLSRSFYCIATVNYAMILWTTVDQYAALQDTIRPDLIPELISQSIETERQLFHAPFAAFFKHYFSCVNSYQRKIVRCTTLLFQDYLHSLSTAPEIEKRTLLKMSELAHVFIRQYDANSENYIQVLYNSFVDIWSHEVYL